MRMYDTPAKLHPRCVVARRCAATRPTVRVPDQPAAHPPLRPPDRSPDKPSDRRTARPTTCPSERPTAQASGHPTVRPSNSIARPATQPTIRPAARLSGNVCPTARAVAPTVRAADGAPLDRPLGPSLNRWRAHATMRGATRRGAPPWLRPAGRDVRTVSGTAQARPTLPQHQFCFTNDQRACQFLRRMTVPDAQRQAAGINTEPMSKMYWGHGPRTPDTPRHRVNSRQQVQDRSVRRKRPALLWGHAARLHAIPRVHQWSTHLQKHP